MQTIHLYSTILKERVKNMISRINHYLRRSGIIAFALGIMTLFTFTGTAAASSTNVRHVQSYHHAQSQETPVGTWHATVYFLTGQFKGQQETQTITFAPDGTLSETASGVGGIGPVKGTGTWNSTSNTTFHFTFNEPLYDNDGHETSYVHVIHDGALLTDGTTYASEGTGEIFTYPDNTPVPSTLNYTASVAFLQ
jgi:hypothetical protein